MFQLTNDQRKCFGLAPVEDCWTLTAIKASPYDNYTTYVYIDGTVIRKCWIIGSAHFQEMDLTLPLTDDLKYILPKTQKGKPALLSSSNLLKLGNPDMLFFYGNRSIILGSPRIRKNYFTTFHDPIPLDTMDDFIRWVEQWCSETTEADIMDIARFSAQERKHVKFREGDVFRFKISRRLYGYGRIVLDYDKMRKKKEPFWDILMTKPLVCSIYHVLTEDPHVTVEELAGLKSLPSHIVTDWDFFYGANEIIGHNSLTGQPDYPIMYGGSLEPGDPAIYLQCGKLFRKREGIPPLARQFVNNGVAGVVRAHRSVLEQCIREDSNDPYWNCGLWGVRHDLRHPENRSWIPGICRQFDVAPTDLIPDFTP